MDAPGDDWPRWTVDRSSSYYTLIAVNGMVQGVVTRVDGVFKASGRVGQHLADFDQLERAQAAVRQTADREDTVHDQAIEDAARICHSRIKDVDSAEGVEAEACAAAVRSLKKVRAWVLPLEAWK